MEALPFDNSKRKTQGNILRQATAGDHNFAPPSASVAAAATAVQMERMMLAHDHHRGVFLNPVLPFSLSSSLPPYYTYSPPPPYPPPQKQRQPPLLPLPAATKPAFLSLPALPSRRHTLSPPARNNYNYTKRQTTNKKPRNPNNPKKHIITSATKTVRSPLFQNGVVVASSTKPVGPEPGNITKDVNRVLLTGSVFSLSPPPSSLPLPKFSLRQPKLSCTVEAAAGEIDDGATDNLSWMLKLR